ncbi:MAG: hypothetical protein JWM45_2843 [Pseudonocardiales bacterium]|nr:hypothetical protein [Pseudonocardiales bacterium]
MRRRWPGGTLSVLLRDSQYFSTFDGPETARSIDLARWGWLWWLAITEDCPPGEGMALEIDKIFWRTARGFLGYTRIRGSTVMTGGQGHGQ